MITMKRAVIAVILSTLFLGIVIYLLIPSDFKMGWLSEKSKNPQQTLAFYKQQAEKTGLNKQLGIKIIEVSRTLGKRDEMRKTYIELLKLYPTDQNIQTAVHKFLTQEAALSSWKEYFEIIEPYPIAPEILTTLASIYASEKDYANQLTIQKRLVRENPNTLALKLDLIALHLQLEQNTQAQNLLRKIPKEQDPDSEQLQRLRLSLLWNELNLEEKEQYITNLLNSDYPELTHYQQALYENYLQLGNFDKALNLLPELQKEKTTANRLLLARAYVWNIEFMQAIPIFEELYEHLSVEEKRIYLNLAVWTNDVDLFLTQANRLGYSQLSTNDKEYIQKSQSFLRDPALIVEYFNQAYDFTKDITYIRKIFDYFFFLGELDQAVSYMKKYLENAEEVKLQDIQLLIFIQQQQGEPLEIIEYLKAMVMKENFEFQDQLEGLLDFYFQMIQHYREGSIYWAEYYKKHPTPAVLHRIKTYYIASRQYDKLINILMQETPEPGKEELYYQMLEQTASFIHNQKARKKALANLYKINPERYFWVFYQHTLKSGAPEDMVGILEFILTQNPINQQMLTHYITVLSHFEEEPRVLWYDRLMEHSFEKDDKLYLGKLLLNNGLISFAQVLYEDILYLDPENIEALKRLGILASWNNNPNQARIFLERAYFLDQDDFEINFYLAENYHVKGETLRAKAFYSKAYTTLMEAPYLDVLEKTILAKCCSRIGVYPLGHSLYKELITNFPADPQLLADFLEMLVNHQSYQEANWYFHHMNPKIDHLNLRLRRLYIRLLIEIEDHVQASRLLKELAEEHPSDPGIWADRGLSLAALDMPRKSWQMYSRALALTPNRDLTKHRQYAYREIGNHISIGTEIHKKSNNEQDVSSHFELVYNFNLWSQIGLSTGLDSGHRSENGESTSASSLCSQFYYHYHFSDRNSIKTAITSGNGGAGGYIELYHAYNEHKWMLRLAKGLCYNEYLEASDADAQYEEAKLSYSKKLFHHITLEADTGLKRYSSNNSKDIQEKFFRTKLSRPIHRVKGLYAEYEWFYASRDNPSRAIPLDDNCRHSLGFYYERDLCKFVRTHTSVGYSLDYITKSKGLYYEWGLKYFPTSQDEISLSFSRSSDTNLIEKNTDNAIYLSWIRYF